MHMNDFCVSADELQIRVIERINRYIIIIINFIVIFMIIVIFMEADLIVSFHLYEIKQGQEREKERERHENEVKYRIVNMYGNTVSHRK